MEPKKPERPKVLSAAQWLEAKEHRVAAEAAAQAERQRVAQQREQRRVRYEAEQIMDAFMVLIADGRDPWGGAAVFRPPVGLNYKELPVLLEVQKELRALGFKVTIEHPTRRETGEQGLGNTWVDEYAWELLVCHP